MKIYNLINTFYIIPGLRVSYDTYYEGGLDFLEIELVWLKWAVSVQIIRNSV